MKEAYVIVKDDALHLIGTHISPLATASTHIHPDPVRTRKLLMHAEEINRLIGSVERADEKEKDWKREQQRLMRTK